MARTPAPGHGVPTPLHPQPLPHLDPVVKAAKPLLVMSQGPSCTCLEGAGAPPGSLDLRPRRHQKRGIFTRAMARRGALLLGVMAWLRCWWMLKKRPKRRKG